jgi:phosphoribosylformylglycinamidine synthase
MGGSHRASLGPLGAGASPEVPRTDLALAPRAARAVAGLIGSGLAAAAHDCSDGGLLTAVAEMLIASGLGADLDLSPVHADRTVAAFAETPGRYVLEVPEADLGRVRAALEGLAWAPIGRLTPGPVLRWAAAGVEAPVERLTAAWRGTLDW